MKQDIAGKPQSARGREVRVLVVVTAQYL